MGNNCGILTFYDDKGKPSFSTITNNFELSIPRIKRKYSSLKDKFVKVKKNPKKTLFDALISFKKDGVLNIVNIYEDYCYLAIDSKKTPFLEIVEDTNSNKKLLGPFRNRFFLADVLQSFCDVFDSPNIQEDNKTIDESLFFYRKDLNPFKKQIKRLNAKLKFKSAEELRKRISIINRYYNHLDFLKATKSINHNFEYNEEKCSIKAGLLVGIGKYDFKINNSIEYRKNEFLSVEKSELDERLIIYEFLKFSNKDF